MTKDSDTGSLISSGDCLGIGFAIKALPKELYEITIRDVTGH